MIICACKLYCQYAFVFSPEHLKSDNISKQKWFKLPKGLSVVTIHCKSPRCCRGGQASRTVVFLSAEAYQNGSGAVSMCILRFFERYSRMLCMCILGLSTFLPLFQIRIDLVPFLFGSILMRHLRQQQLQLLVFLSVQKRQIGHILTPQMQAQLFQYHIRCSAQRQRMKSKIVS